MTRFAFKHLGRDVIRRSTDCALLLAVEIELGGQAEVAQLDLHLVVEEQVAQLQISMDDSVLVQVLQSMDNLSRVALHFKFMQALSSFQKLIHALVLAEF